MAVSLTLLCPPLCPWYCCVLDPAVSLTPLCPWPRCVLDPSVSLTPLCPWHRSVLDRALSTAVSLILLCHWYCCVLDPAVSLTPLCPWQLTPKNSTEMSHYEWWSLRGRNILEMLEKIHENQCFNFGDYVTLKVRIFKQAIGSNILYNNFLQENKCCPFLFRTEWLRSSNTGILQCLLLQLTHIEGERRKLCITTFGSKNKSKQNALMPY